LFFGVIWSLYKELWGISFGGLVFVVTLIATDRFSIPLSFAGSLLMGLVFGGLGNRWIESSLVKRGFVAVTQVDAANVDDALAQAMSLDSTTGKVPGQIPNPPTDIRQHLRNLAIEIADGGDAGAEKIRALLTSTLTKEERTLVSQEALKYAKLVPIYEQVNASLARDSQHKRVRELVQQPWNGTQVTEELDRILETEPNFYDLLVASAITQQIEPWNHIISGHRSDYERRKAAAEQERRRNDVEKALQRKRRKHAFERCARLAIAFVALMVLAAAAIVGVNLWKTHTHRRNAKLVAEAKIRRDQEVAEEKLRHMRQAAQNMKNNEWAAAIPELQAVIALEPNAIDAWTDLALAQRKITNLDGASIALRHLKASGSDTLDAWKEVGDRFIDATNWNGAIDCYKEVARLSTPTSSAAHFKLAALYETNGNVEDAATTYEAIVSMNGMDALPNKIRAQILTAELYERHGDLVAAVRAYQQLLPDPVAVQRLRALEQQRAK
jgi:tetratricopeptide (TPR) repeat protein